MLTGAEALGLPDRQVWGIEPVTVSGCQYANGLICSLVDREGDPKDDGRRMFPCPARGGQHLERDHVAP